jgi:hypothetical protein
MKYQTILLSLIFIPILSACSDNRAASLQKEIEAVEAGYGNYDDPVDELAERCRLYGELAKVEHMNGNTEKADDARLTAASACDAKKALEEMDASAERLEEATRGLFPD